MLTPTQIVRAWRDGRYRDGLTDEQRAGLPSHPSGMIDLTAQELAGVIGGDDTVDLLLCPSAICTESACFTIPDNPATIGYCCDMPGPTTSSLCGTQTTWCMTCNPWCNVTHGCTFNPMPGC